MTGPKKKKKKKKGGVSVTYHDRMMEAFMEKIRYLRQVRVRNVEAKTQKFNDFIL